jgi:hypothetical protein
MNRSELVGFVELSKRNHRMECAPMQEILIIKLRAEGQYSRQELWRIVDTPHPPDVQERLAGLQKRLQERRRLQGLQVGQFLDPSGSQ